LGRPEAGASPGPTFAVVRPSFYGDYIEQLTYLLFLKMAHERTQPPLNQPSIIPKEYDWPSLFEYEGIPLERLYRDVLQQ